MTIEQANRPTEVKSPLGQDVLVFQRMEAREELGRPYQIDLSLASDDHDIAYDDLIGKPMSVRIDTQDGGKRWFHGLVSACGYRGPRGRRAIYAATLRPKLWFLGNTVDCRIFQEMSVTDIISQLLDDAGIEYELRTSGSYSPLDYCVQYEETTLSFLMRLMEQIGLYFYFEHSENSHLMVIADDIGGHATVSGYETVAFQPPELRGISDKETINEWRSLGQVTTGKATFRNYAFGTPETYEKEVEDAGSHDMADGELYRFSRLFRDDALEATDSETQAEAEAHLQCLRAQAKLAQAEGNARGLMTGALFTLENLGRSSENIEYLITQATYTVRSDLTETGFPVDAADQYLMRFTCIPSAVRYRAQRITPRPVMNGVQTAVVVGPSGEEIHTDSHGRCKVQFHWDREGGNDENSSCWMRVSQAWAGAGWGWITIPRIGQEVLVDFLEGDPDRPVITGRLYNGANTPPYELPGEKNKSTFKSDTVQGDGFNELRFDDTAGSEEIYMHAQKDKNVKVLNDHTEEVDHDQKVTIGNDQTEDVGHDRTETVGNDESLDVGNNQSISVGMDRTVDVGKNQTHSIQMKGALTANVEYKITVGGSSIKMTPASIEIKSPMITVQADAMCTVKGAMVEVNGSGMTMIKGGLVMVN